MKINSPEYKQWKRRQNEKNLLRRSKRKKAKHKAITAQRRYNEQIKQSLDYNHSTKMHEFHTPLNFSLVGNFEETSAFFNKIISFITNEKNYGKKIFIDISKISNLTIDALMYLLAIVNNLSANFKGKYSFSGNAPADPNARKLFTESGFYQFVEYQGDEPLTKNNDNVQIMSGENCDTDLAKRLSDFVCEKANVNKRCCSFLYNMVIELMSNTHKHAYPDENAGLLHSRWYCFAEYDKQDTVSFSFMDTGAGIPSTVKKKFSEKIDFLHLKGEHKYVVSALDGEFRTSTNKVYRGKGLPKIREFCSSNKIKNLHILTNKAEVVVYKDCYSSRDIATPLCGTLYYWQIDLKFLKEELYADTNK